jgi:hypothetical protein
VNDRIRNRQCQLNNRHGRGVKMSVTVLTPDTCGGIRTPPGVVKTKSHPNRPTGNNAVCSSVRSIVTSPPSAFVTVGVKLNSAAPPGVSAAFASTVHPVRSTGSPTAFKQRNTYGPSVVPRRMSKSRRAG